LKLARFEFVFDLLKLKLAWVYLSLTAWVFFGPLLVKILTRTAVSHSHWQVRVGSVTGTRLQGACGHIVRLDLWQEIGQNASKQLA